MTSQQLSCTRPTLAWCYFFIMAPWRLRPLFYAPLRLFLIIFYYGPPGAFGASIFYCAHPLYTLPTHVLYDRSLMEKVDKKQNLVAKNAH